MRDKWLENGFVNFLVEAYRFRVKANYVDSIYLSYGKRDRPGIRTESRGKEGVA